MATVLMLPNRDFDPTETGVPWRLLRGRGHRVVLATPDGTPGQADAKMVTGKGLGIFAPFMKVDANGRAAYDEMAQSAEFERPISYGEIRADNFDALLLPGGHELSSLKVLCSPESNLLARFDLDGFTGRRIAFHAGSAVPYLQDTEADETQATPLLRCLVMAVTKSASIDSACLFAISWLAASSAARCFRVARAARSGPDPMLVEDFDGVAKRHRRLDRDDGIAFAGQDGFDCHGHPP